MQTPPNTQDMDDFSSDMTTTVEDLAAVLAARTAENAVAAKVAAAVPANLDMVMRIPVSVKVVLGSTTMPVSKLMKLGRGAVVPLDRRVGEPVDVVVNGRVVARGEVVIVDEETSRFGISLTEVLGPAGADH